MVGKLKSLEEVLSNDVGKVTYFDTEYVDFLLNNCGKTVRGKVLFGHMENKDWNFILMERDLEWIITDAQYKVWMESKAIT